MDISTGKGAYIHGFFTTIKIYKKGDILQIM